MTFPTKSLLVACLLVSTAYAEEAPPVPAPAPAPVPLPAPVPIVVPGPPVVPVLRPLREVLPLAGYADGMFYIRNPHDWFVIYPRGRLQVDGYFFPARGDAPPGVESNSAADPRPRSTIFVRRARAEVQGTFLGHFDFHISGEFGSTPSTGAYGTVSDCFVIIDYLPYLKFQAGQFNAPFMLENRTSNKVIDFMERSTTVRAFGIPQNKDAGAMLFGTLPRKVARYEVGLFNGEGVQAIRNQDNNFVFLGRSYVAPLAPFARDRQWMENIWVGGSIWYGRNNNLGGFAPAGTTQDDFPPMTTQGGVSFFNTSYGNGTDSAGNTVRSHLIPHGSTLKGAVEVNIPIKKAGLRFELVHQKVELAQFNDTNPDKATIKRNRASSGVLDGISYYITVYAWILGDTSFLSGIGNPEAPRLKRIESPVKPPKWGLMVAAKYENVNFDVTGLPAGIDGMGAPTVDPAEGNYRLHVFELGLNAWATKHLRITANYVMNYMDGDAPNMKKNFYYHKPEHELLFRLGVTL